MPIILDHQLREQIPHDDAVFPISYFQDELAALPNHTSPLHWHPDFEIATAASGVLDFQVGRQHFTLEAGDSIFVNGNMLHGVRQLSGGRPDPMPNIVFSGAVIAPETSAIYRNYIHPIACCDALPCVVFPHADSRYAAVHRAIRAVYRQMQEQGPCYEMAVQRELNALFTYLSAHFSQLPKLETTRVQINTQIRIQKMLRYIYAHYAEAVTLEEIAGAAHISRSEAGRCFHTYLGCSPVDALIRYRLQTARGMLSDAALTIQQISDRCGFHSVQYFSRQFKKFYGCTPGQARSLGK